MSAQHIEQHAESRRSPESQIIPAPGANVTGLRIFAFLAIIAGVALRLLFVLRFPAPAGDSDMYLQLARNWADHHSYGLWLDGYLIPTDLRMPGYPAFLAGIAMVLGRSVRAILLSQVALDLCTCYLTALLGAALAPLQGRRAVWIAALWLAATCPFTANYNAVVLTETLTSFLTTAALIFYVFGLRLGQDASSPQYLASPGYRSALLGSFLTGLATLVRPEMPLLLIAAALVYVFQWWGSAGIRKTVLLAMGMAGVFLLPLAPWATRNVITVHKAQILSPRYVTLPDEYAPVGYYSWTKTWLVRYRDVYLALWKIEDEPVEIDDLPPSAFGSPQEKAHVADLLDQYNSSADLDISPDLDQQFAEVARERTKRNPLRTYIRVPFERALTIWFTPRTELLPIDGKLWPLRQQWSDSHADVLITAGLGALGYLYIAFATGGIWMAWRTRRKVRSGSIAREDLQDGSNLWGVALLVFYLVIRTLFLTTVEAPEPRYVIPCYAAVLALIALLFSNSSN